MLKRLKKFLILIPLMFLVGCPGQVHIDNPAVHLTGTNIAQAQAHISTAENITSKVKNDVSPNDKMILNLVSDEHKSALTNLTQANTELVQAQKNFDKQLSIEHKKTLDAQTEAGQWKDKYVKAIHTWGYILEQWVIRLSILLLILVGIHIALGIASLFVSPPIGKILKLIGGIVNPFAWFQYLIDHFHLNQALNSTGK